MTSRFAESRRLWDIAQSVLPGGVNSNVKMAERPHPLFFRQAAGSRLYDSDGNEYIDYTCGYGPVILGHAHPAVVAAVQLAAANGFLYGGQHEGEVELATLLAESVPCIEMVRFTSSGSEAVAAAVRLARAYTRRERVVRFAGHYHGWLDEQLISSRPPLEAGERIPVFESAGQSPAAAANVVVLPWNDAHAVEEVFRRDRDRIAAVLMEPVMCNTGVIMPRSGYLDYVRALCTDAGALLIFDEIITGFRLHLGGAQAVLGVIPDLAVFGKAMANGFPIAAFGGPRKIMELISTAGVVHSGTFNGNPLAVTAAVATIQELRKGGTDLYRSLAARGQTLMAGIRQAASSHGVSVLLQGPGPVFYMWFTDDDAVTSYRDSASIDRTPYERFALALLEGGVRVIPGGRWYVSCSHTEKDVNRTLEIVSEALARVA